MIRRHLTPALVAFTALLLSCLGAPYSGPSWWIAAAARVSSLPPPPRRLLGARAFPRAGVLLLGASAGLLLGAGSQVRMANDSARSFLPIAGKRGDGLHRHRCPGQQPLAGGGHGPAAGDERGDRLPAGVLRRRARGSLSFSCPGTAGSPSASGSCVHAPLPRMDGLRPRDVGGARAAGRRAVAADSAAPSGHSAPRRGAGCTARSRAWGTRRPPCWRRC